MKIKRWTTEQDTPVLYAYCPENPMVEINVVFFAGSAYDGNQDGLAQLTNLLIKQGTAKYDVNQVAKLFNELGARLQVNADRDTASISMLSLSDKKYFDPAFSLFAELITAPSFPETGFLRAKKMIANAIKQQSQMPDIIARDCFFSAIFNGHSYAHPVLGTTTSIKAIELNDVRSFYKKFYIARNAFITIVGDLPQEKAKKIANLLTLNLKPGKMFPALPKPSLQKNSSQLIQFPSEQSQVLLGQIAINYNDPDYFPLLLACNILGGPSAAARLFKQIREKNGLTYNIGCRLAPLKVGGFITINFKTRRSQVKHALNLTEQVITQFYEQGTNKTELMLVKKKIINGFPMAMATNHNISYSLQNLGLFDLPITFYDSYCDNIMAVTPAMIKKMNEKYLNLNNLVVIVVGGA